MDSKKARDEASKLFIYCIVSTLIFAVIWFISSNLTNTPCNHKNASIEANARPVVIIDAGHGGEDGGTSSKDGITEKELNLDISLRLYDLLRASGIEVILTRDEDILLYDRNVDYQGRKKVLDLAARLKIGKENENATFVSIHMNAFPEEKYSGLQVYYSNNNEQSSKLAENIQNYTKDYLQPNNNRKIKKATSSIYLLDRLTSPAVLVECGFLSNPEESRLLATEEYRQKLSLIISCAIIESIYNNNT